MNHLIHINATSFDADAMLVERDYQLERDRGELLLSEQHGVYALYIDGDAIVCPAAELDSDLLYDEYGDGYGTRRGDGGGFGEGFGYGDGDGFGDGDGYGDGDGDGYGIWSGDGHEPEIGDGYGDGDEYGNRDGYGDGFGCGEEDEDGDGYGNWNVTHDRALCNVIKP